MKCTFNTIIAFLSVPVLMLSARAQTTPLDNYLLPSNPIPFGVTSIEYTFDNDPGFGNGVTVHFSPCTVVANLSTAIDASSLPNGLHTLYVRARNKNNAWSQTNNFQLYKVSQDFQIPASQQESPIEAIEYFFDEDPGVGNGTLKFISPTTELNNYTLAIDVSSLSKGTMHTLYIRTINPTSLTMARLFSLEGTLPLTWISFSGQLQNDNSVLLKWETAAEKNVALFVIERSIDGHSFKKAGSIEPRHNSTGRSLYTFIDKNPATGKVFYRIKQLDIDNKFSYSPTIVVNIENNSQKNFYIINNPGKDKLRLHLGRVPDSRSQLQIFDLSGRILTRKEVSADPIQEIDISTLASGIYFVRYVNKNGSAIARFKKE